MPDLINSLFDPKGLNLNTTEAPTENSREFKPSYKKGGESGRFEAIIRFLPNPENPKDLSIIQKWSVFLKNPLTDQGRTVDSPSTVGEPDPLSQMYFALKNSKNAQAAQFADNFKRHQNYYSLVQVIECQQDPSLTNKILVWKYGIKIYEKICQEKTPVMQGQAPGQPFDLFKGRLFKVVAVKQQNFNNLDQSYFFDIAYPNNCMRIIVDNPQVPGQKQVVPATLEIAQTDQGKQLISNYLTEHAPKLSDYMYRPWNDDTKKYVDEMILLHGKILNGVPITSLQQASMAGAMSVGQQPFATAPSISPINGGQPVASVPGSVVPGTVQVPPAPAAPSLGSILGTQTVPPAPVSPVAPSTPVTSTPTVGLEGLSVGTDMPGIQTPDVPGQANIQGIDMSSVDSILGSNAAPPQPQSVPGVGDLTSILNTTVV